MMAMLTQILDVIGYILNGILSFIQSFVTVITMLPQFLVFITSLIGVSPSFITSFMVVGVTASIIFLILGRS